MPSDDSTDRTAALAELSEYVPIAVAPVLTSGELEAVLDRNKQASYWAATTAFTLGAFIQPTTKNGHRYKCTQAGTTGSTEPTFPLGTGSLITIGTAKFIEDGVEFANVYNVQRAAEQGWRLKAAKASQFISTGDINFAPIFERCNQMAQSYAPLVFG